MTNPIAVFLGLLVFGGLAADWYFYDGASTLFLGRKCVDMIEWMAFWR